ncbi:N-6 DNA methylase [Nocardia sp. NPDC050717]|uniref:N-6 DNA methylase n=1 Tax=Nocardia sp. NPDC050717 TaxID=3157221 RepID=UPI00341023B2
MTDPDNDERRVSQTELAGMIDVKLGTISNWVRRDLGFPQGRSERGSVTYSVREVLPWLDARPVPAGLQQPTDAPDITYGDRLRNSLATEALTTEPRDLPRLSDPTKLADRTARTVGALVQTLKDEFHPRSSIDTDKLDAALLLTFVWICDRASWQLMEAGRGGVTGIVAGVGAALRKFGIDAAAVEPITRLSATSEESHGRLVRRCANLGVLGFESILSRREDQRTASALDYRTPPEIATLMGLAAIPADGAPHTVADPYARQGELAMAVPAPAGQDGPKLTVSVADQQTARRTRMHMLVRGRTATIEVGAGAQPWRRRTAQKFDAVVTNPPFNQHLGRDDRDGWQYGTPQEDNANLAWVQTALRLSTGHAVVLMPVAATVRGRGTEEDPRHGLVTSGALRAVIRLSGDLLKFSPADTTVWVLGPERSADPTIVFVDATGLKRKQRGQDRPRLVAVTEIDLAVRELGAQAPGVVRDLTHRIAPDDTVLGRAVAVRASEVAAQGFMLTPHTYLELKGGSADAQWSVLDKAAADAATARNDVLAHLRTTPSRCRPGTSTDWQTKLLAEICRLTMGPSALRQSHLAESGQGGLPILRPRNIDQRRISTDGLDVATPMATSEFKEWVTSGGDIVLVRAGQIHKAALVEGDFTGLIDSNLVRLRVRTVAEQRSLGSEEPVEVDPRYLLEFLLRGAGIAQIRATASVNVVPSIGVRKLGTFLIGLPPIEEQRRIAAFLTAQEERIVALRTALSAEEALRAELADRLMTGALAVDEQL